MARYSRRYRKYKYKYRHSRKKKSYRRSIQKIKTMRYPKRNIFGDRAKMKLFGTRPVLFSLTSANGWSNQFAYALGALRGTTRCLVGNSVDSLVTFIPGLTRIQELYQRYRVKGLKLQITVYGTQGGGYVPFYVYADAAADETEISATSTGPEPPFSALEAATIPELRWSRYKVIRNAAQGGNVTKLTHYFELNKIAGPDRTIRSDLDYTGRMDAVISNWTAPKRSPWIRYGVFPMIAPADFPAGEPTVTLYGLVSATIYVEAWGKTPITT